MDITYKCCTCNDTLIMDTSIMPITGFFTPPEKLIVSGAKCGHIYYQRLRVVVVDDAEEKKSNITVVESLKDEYIRDTD